jgi:serine/threonine protein kinase
MPLSVVERLGPHKILAPIGPGGMGEVWKARDTRLDRVVAIKQLKREHAARFEQAVREKRSLTTDSGGIPETDHSYLSK